MKIEGIKYFTLITFTTFLNIVLTQQGTKCDVGKFQCNSGQCIDSSLLCDGTADCRDRSDETQFQCSNQTRICPPYSFRCNYGACIDGDLTCNGKQDCIDNSDETLPRCKNGVENTSPRKCSLSQFRCDNGQCIDAIDLCDGKFDCMDKSDETSSKCSQLDCHQFLFRCNYGACVDGDSKCNGKRDCVDGSDEDPKLCINLSIPTASPPPIITPKPISNFCTVPPQPENGYRKLYKAHCPYQQTTCDVQEGIKLPTGAYLIYSCNSGYRINGSKNVFCGPEGEWLIIPVCTEILCESLASVSTNADCTYNNNYASCESSIKPGTTAKLSCRNSYHEGETYLSNQQKEVTCNNMGQWEPPNPLQCVPVCGVVSSKGPPLIVNGRLVDVSSIPWHATLYIQEIPDGPKKFICGATIIKDNFLLTAAHCIYDETNRRIEDPNKYYIATGNYYRDYDSLLNSPLYVKKARVTSIYVKCNYLGFEGNYASDIAILKIDKPFVFSSLLLPACMDSSYIDSGLGIVAGFGRTSTEPNTDGSGSSSFIIQFTKLPYIPFNQCKSVINTIDSEKFITDDKFCAGYTNGTSVCDGDSGGGLVFQTRNLWYLRGIVSTGLGVTLNGGVPHCNSFSYSVYTRISSHIEWVQDIISRVETSRPLPPCHNSNSYTNF